MLGIWRTLGGYERVQEEQDECGDKTVNRDVGRAAFGKRFSIGSLILAFLLGTSCTAGLGAIVLSTSSPATYETGFHTDIASLRKIVNVVPTQFTGTLRYKNGEHLYIDLGPDGVQYFGGPIEAIDRAWNDLLIGLDEETFFEGETVGPDVLHSLHCLNEVRKVLDSPYYYNRTLESMNRGKRIHIGTIDHCLNHIRQVLQCHMDITPVKTEYFEDINVEVGNFDQIHMCRDFSILRSWMKEKQTAQTGVAMKEHNNGTVRHRLGYPDNEESMLPWHETETEFD